MIQREKAVLEFMEANPTWEDFAPWVAALNEFEFFMMKWYLRNDLTKTTPREIEDHENPLARRLANVEFGDLDQEFGHLIERFSREEGPRKYKDKLESQGKDMAEDEDKVKEREKERKTNQVTEVKKTDNQDLDADWDIDIQESAKQGARSSSGPKTKSRISSDTRKERGDWD
ncbi:hypothetical protein ONS95_002122 [Cadophora gregata]|uniref:uncharacterized protein n=1 Tax=Cadophora gregata TaxID=51156 RepID=UPI0026DD91BF|nr:uncharacterized protein ONS95_002122 [Cadophora gregata]KAK0109426.1 hypothetical protein ONS95_002122 [Cadophora gregata]KAK0110945.1 hypothetical protein ONS96_002530 [Cadophora gregata f. sp. sojae]